MANNSIGTAWIQIRPTTKGIKSALSSELSGEATASGEKAGSSFSTGFAAKMGIVTSITGKIFDKVTATITSSFDSAISRADTLNNFTNVMSNLNIAESESQAAIDKLSDKLDGLPTTLDSAASAVQRFTSANSDIDKSTDMFLALNNALLAGGASADIQSSALEQISQAYAKGKPDMVEWRSLLQAMPAQATQLGKAFGLSSEELGEALRKGDISMDEFMNKVMELNVVGAEGFKSFEEQARAATGTLGTQITNIQTSLTKVITAALNGDDMSKPLNQLVDRIIEVAPKLINAFVQAFMGLVSAIPKLIPPLVQAIVDMLPGIIEGIGQLAIELVRMLPEVFPIILGAIPDLIIALVNTLTNPEFLSAILQAGITLFTQLQLALPDILIALLDALPDLIVNLVEFFTNPDNIMAIFNAGVQMFMGIVKAVPRILSALFGAFGELFGRLWELLKSRFGEFASTFGEFLGGIFKGAINGVLQFIENFINSPIKLINKFIGLINKAFGAIGVNIGEIGLIKLPRLASGGIVTGIGTDMSDSNLYALSKGEYVIRAAAAREIGYNNLDQMNATGEVSGNQVTNYFTINSNQDPEEIANMVSRKIALKTQGVLS